MSEAKHTPGPWCVDTTNVLGAYGVWTDYATHPGHDGSGYGSQICSVLTDAFKLTDKTSRAIRDANAQLISAAPDLLRELTTFHDYAIQLGIHHCGQDGQPCPVQAAINKATGVTS